MAQKIPIYIPTLISDINYNPAKVYPRIFFYNGKIDCEPYYFEHKLTSGSSTWAATELNEFPYFDHYNVVSGSFPTVSSRSLLFQNENTSYGSIPSGSLYTDYWANYINLLYDPYTRLINCKGIIPLMEYFKMELNDLVQWRGNTYHLRAINNYDLREGTCDIQLLGPILRTASTGRGINCAFEFEAGDPVTTTTSTTTEPPITTTTTTTGGPTWYVLERCDDANIFYSVQYPAGTFANRERVTVTVPGPITYTYIIINALTFDPFGGQLTLTATGQFECP